MPHSKILPKTGPGAGKPNPFQWYVGRTVAISGRPSVVENVEVRGDELCFVLRDPASGEVHHVDPVVLVSAPLLD